MTRPAEHRTSRRYRCQTCSAPFFAHYQGHRLFCSNSCSAEANRHRHRRLRELQDAAYYKTMTPEQIVAGLAALHVEPELWDETEPEKRR